MRQTRQRGIKRKKRYHTNLILVSQNYTVGRWWLAPMHPAPIRQTEMRLVHHIHLFLQARITESWLRLKNACSNKLLHLALRLGSRSHDIFFVYKIQKQERYEAGTTASPNAGGSTIWTVLYRQLIDFTALHFQKPPSVSTLTLHIYRLHQSSNNTMKNFISSQE